VLPNNGSEMQWFPDDKGARMDALPTAKLSAIAFLRVSVAQFGEKASSLSRPRWPTQFPTAVHY